MKRGEIVYRLDELDDTAAFVYSLLNGTKIIALTGDLGAGKTVTYHAYLKKLDGGPCNQ